MEQRVQYQELHADRIVETIGKLSRRIERRFPDSGLLRVSEKLSAIGRRAQNQASWIARPIIGLRLAVGFLFVIILVGIMGTISSVDLPLAEVGFVEFVQTLEAGINDLVLIGVAVFFLITLERRFKRHRALQALHELRAVAHIIDMHQLTKDPDQFMWESRGMVPTEGKFTAVQLSRYLDYCSEMLSLLGKIAVLYVQRFDDPVALAAVNEIESLTTGLSRKIWQKLMILHSGSLFETKSVASRGA